MDAKTKNSLTNENIRDLLNNSANKTNNNLIFFFSFGLYVFISVINTSDIALLLPRHSFKMPFIDFELGLLHFYVLAPLLLLLLHFNLLFNHYKNLESLDKYKNKINLTTINPSLYGFAFVKGGKIEGFFINLVLYLVLYILPLIVFITMYIRFSDYHHSVITPMHLIIIMLDLLFIALSIFYCSKHSFTSIEKYHSIKTIFFFGIVVGIGAMMIQYYGKYYSPIVYGDYNQTNTKDINQTNTKFINQTTYICKIIVFFKNDVCFPRLVVAEEEMAKISKDALYIPRHLTMVNITDKKKLEHDLIIKHGTRIDLSNRNLRYAILKRSLLTRANLQNTQLQGANLNDAHMQATILSHAKLTDAVMMFVKLESAYLDGASLQGANLFGAHLENIYADYSTNFDNTIMYKVRLSWDGRVDTNGIHFKKVLFKDANLTRMNFSGTILTGSIFMNANLTDSDFRGANLTDTNFQSADLTDSDFRGVTFSIHECPSLPGMPPPKYKAQCGIPYFKNATMLRANLFNTKLIKDTNLNKDQINTIINIEVK